jgi:hypothetical protein
MRDRKSFVAIWIALTCAFVIMGFAATRSLGEGNYAFQMGNIKLSRGATPDQVQLVISSYLEPNDSTTITFDKAAKTLQSIQSASYLDSASDAVKIGVQFAKLPEMGLPLGRNAVQLSCSRLLDARVPDYSCTK